MKYLIHKRFTFEAGHQLRRGCFTAACSDCIHGHSYKVEVTVEASRLDENSMVVDFGLVKLATEQVRTIFDHALLLPTGIAEKFSGSPHLRKVVTTRYNPTAEAIAEAIFELVGARLAHELGDRQHEVRVVAVRVWETENGSAEVRV